ncbi:MAG TPA: hypothetical protein VGW12_05010 [Pyrinomonadaceae bacterium]|nr:hypothetical protein [Pyrinomonadaceae bacterium]
MKRVTSYVVCLALFTSAFVHPASAQSTDYVGGVVNTYLAGRKIITERYGFTVERDGELSGGAEMTYAEGFTILTGTRASESRPIHFGANITNTEILAAQFNMWPTVYVRVANQPNREWKTRASVVLETFYWHHYLFLLRQFERGKSRKQNFFCLVPGRAREFELSVELADTTVYEVADRAIETRHYRIAAPGEPLVELWTDKQNRPLLICIEAQQVKAVEEGMETLAEVILKANAKRLAPKPELRSSP